MNRPLPRLLPLLRVGTILIVQMACPAFGSDAPAPSQGQGAASLADAPLVQPWRSIALDPEYSGAWVVAGDLDGDGQVDIVGARNVDRNDVHFTADAPGAA